MSGINPEFIGGRIGDLLVFVMKIGSAMLSLMVTCWSNERKLSNINQPACGLVTVDPRVELWSREQFPYLTSLIVNLYVRLVIQPFFASMNRTHVGVNKQDNSHPRTAVVTQHVQQRMEMLPWIVRSPDRSRIEHAWAISGLQLQCHPQASLTVIALTG